MARLSLVALLAAVAACGGAIEGAPPAAPDRGGAEDDAAPPEEGGELTDDPLAPAALMRDVRHLASGAMRGRGSTTADEARAAAWLAEQLEAIGLRPVGGAYVHAFAVTPGRAARGITWGDTSRNVLGELVPTGTIDDRVLVVGAHYDHDGMAGGVLHPGADDNASGVAAVLGVARALVAEPERVGRRVVFAFFGAEEIGLLGAWAMTRSGPVPMARVAAMVNVDMIGRPLQDQPTFRFAQSVIGIDAARSIGVAGLRDRPWLESIVRGACAAEGHRAVTVDDLPESLQGMAARVSRARGDHFPFEQAGVPAVIFSSGESVDYHEPTDTPDTLDPELLATRARIVLRTVFDLSSAAIPAR
jgi:acetylornithine deacetylase/succinyl-diaminopimelate desuccinylase-like protein